MGRHETELVSWLRNHAAGLSYLGSNSVLKQQLHEAAGAIEGSQVMVAKLGWNHVGISAPGHNWRRLTWRERLALWLLRGETEVRP